MEYPMLRKGAVLVSLVAILTVGLSGIAPLDSKVHAQLPTFFGATRFPAIDVDKADKLYLMMSVATALPSEGRPHSQIFFTMSKDQGRNWDNLPNTRNLTKSPGEAFGPSVAVTKRGTPRVYVTYHDNSTGPTQMYLIRSKKKTKFRRPQNITTHSGGAFNPRMALDSNEVLNFVWGDIEFFARKVLFRRSTDLGETFSDPVDVSRSAGDAFEPEIAVGPDDSINVCWEDTGPGVSSAMFSRSVDGGQTFSEPLRLSRGPGSATETHIAVDRQGRINVVWVEDISGKRQAFYSRSSDQGETFSEPVNVTDDSDANISKPTLAVFGDIVYVAFQKDTSPRQVFLTRSEDAGAVFQNAVRVSNADNRCGRGHSPAMVVDSQGTLHIVWIDSSRVQSCTDEGILFYSNSTNGRRFSQERMIIAGIS
jgi:hypothetical protein